MINSKPFRRPNLRSVDNVKIGFEERCWVWTGFIWLRMGTSSRIL
jgi:hypothetical protein